MCPEADPVLQRIGIGKPLSNEAAAIAALPNLGLKSAQALVKAGVASLAELRRLGSVAAYAKVKQQVPKTTLNLLWANEGALSGQPSRGRSSSERTAPACSWPWSSINISTTADDDVASSALDAA